MYTKLQNYEYFCLISIDGEINNSNVNSELADGVINIFNHNPYLGMLCSPLSVSEETGYVLDSETHNILAQEIADNLGLEVCLDLKKKGFLYSKNVWFRKDAIISYFGQECFCQGLYKCYLGGEGKYKWFPLIFPYLVQKQGFYSGMVFDSRCISERIGAYQKTLSCMVKDQLVYRGVKEFRNVRKVNPKLISFCRNYNDVYIYGAGDIGNECFRYLKMNGVKIRGFVVSDGRRFDCEINKVPVWELSELVQCQQSCFVISVSQADREMIQETLAGKGITNVVCYEE